MTTLKKAKSISISEDAWQIAKKLAEKDSRSISNLISVLIYNEYERITK